MNKQSKFDSKMFGSKNQELILTVTTFLFSFILCSKFHSFVRTMHILVIFYHSFQSVIFFDRLEKL